MKTAKVAALMLAMGVVCGGVAQQTGTASTSTSSTTPAQHPHRAKRHVAPTPASIRPEGVSKVSTSEAGGLHDKPRLHTLPTIMATQLTGESVAIDSVGRPNHWLLFYRLENCAPCDHVMDALAASDNAAMKSGSLVIVVANNGNARGGNRLDALRAKYANLSNVTWLQDSKGALLAGLKPHGVPMLYAMSGKRIAWSVPGALGDPSKVQTMASAWLASADPERTHPLVSAISTADTKK